MVLWLLYIVGHFMNNTTAMIVDNVTDLIQQHNNTTASPSPTAWGSYGLLLVIMFSALLCAFWIFTLVIVLGATGCDCEHAWLSVLACNINNCFGCESFRECFCFCRDQLREKKRIAEHRRTQTIVGSPFALQFDNSVFVPPPELPAVLSLHNPNTRLHGVFGTASTVNEVGISDIGIPGMGMDTRNRSNRLGYY